MRFFQKKGEVSASLLSHHTRKIQISVFLHYNTLENRFLSDSAFLTKAASCCFFVDEFAAVTLSSFVSVFEGVELSFSETADSMREKPCADDAKIPLFWLGYPLTFRYRQLCSVSFRHLCILIPLGIL